MKKNVYTFAMITILFLPLGCQRNYRLGMESGPWGIPLVKIQRSSKIPNGIDPFIKNTSVQNELQPPKTFGMGNAVNAESELDNDSGIQQAGFKTHGRTKNPFGN